MPSAFLPAPLAASVRPFSLECFRHVDIARTDGEILEMFSMQQGEMGLESCLKGFG